MSSNAGHACPEPGCSKTFKRREHLSRHRMNHKPKAIHSCEECHKVFVRQDLLQRHRQRHQRGMQSRNSGGYRGEISRSVSMDLMASEAVTLPMISASGDVTIDHGEESTMVTSPVADVCGIPIISGPQVEYESVPDIAGSADHHTFFDPTTTLEDTTADLDWLFGASPLNQNLSVGQAISATSEVASTSPTSTFSIGTADIVENDQDPWITGRGRILDALSTLPPEILTEPFFEPENLQLFFEAYFRNYNTHFPIIHRPTLSIATVQPLLLVALLTLGAAMSSDIRHYHTAERIHEHIRWLIFSSGSFEPPAPLWLLQALLLVQAYEKMLSTRKQHEMSHICHSAVITLMRRVASYSIDTTEDGSGDHSEDRAWRIWVERESSKRVAYFAFIMDAQHASILGHVPSLSVSDLRLRLPSAEEPWESVTASRWRRVMSRHEEPAQFLPTLRSLLSRRPLSASCSPYARFVLLHALLCVTKHMQGRDMTALDVSAERSATSDTEFQPSPVDEDWKEVMHRALDTWSFSLLSQEPSQCLEAGRTLHRIAHVVIHVSLVDFHTFAGAPSLVSSRVAKDEYERAQSRLRRWSHTKSARRALTHCVLLIQETMFTRKRYRASEDINALRPWCLYHASLVLWTYGVMTEGEPPNQYLGAEEYLVHMLSGLMGDADRLRDTNQTCGLLRTVQRALEGGRWELLREAYGVLGRLIQPDKGG